MRVVNRAGRTETYLSALHRLPDAMMVATAPVALSLGAMVVGVDLHWVSEDAPVVRWAVAIGLVALIVLMVGSLMLDEFGWHRRLAVRRERRWLQVRAEVWAQWGRTGQVDRQRVWRTVRAWMWLPVTGRRRLLLLKAGIPLSQVWRWSVWRLRRSELETLGHLRRAS